MSARCASSVIPGAAAMLAFGPGRSSVPRIGVVPLLLDVTDLVEFYQRHESVSGVQRVIAEVAPRLLADRVAVGAGPATAVVLDRSRGVFVPLTTTEATALIGPPTPTDRAAVAAAATACLGRARAAEPARIDADAVLMFLGAVWINDALMLAARAAHAAGARCVYLLYDLTPVLQAGHTATVNRLFDRYLLLATQTASAVPAISVSSRRDYERHCHEHGRVPPPGGATGLPCGLTPDRFDTTTPPWPRPFALFVGTVESRKNHLLALRAWRRLLQRHGPDAVPDLVCVGRLGWHADDFLREYLDSGGLGGRLTVLSTSVPDDELARFYAHAQFTVYPSRYEGWGLPVSESLAFGKVAIVADNSSLREAGGDAAVYFPTDDEDAFVAAIEEHGLDPAGRRAAEGRLAGRPVDPITWEHVAQVLSQEVEQMGAERAPQVFPSVELGREYVLAVGQPPPDAGYADRYFAHLLDQGRTPLLGQPRGDRDFETVDAAVIGTVGSPQSWGLEVRPGRRVDFRLTRPVDGPLTLLVGTRSMPGLAVVESAGPGGPTRQELYLGSVLAIPLGDGPAGEATQACLSVVDASDSIEGFVGISSFVVLRADDLTAQVVAHRAAASALRAELDFMQGTRSWRVTAPLRRLKGRGSG